MQEVTSPVLFPPLLLATDGSSSARLAQKWLYLIAQTLPQPEESKSTLVMALMVQPRRSSRSNQLLRRIRRLPEPQPDEPQDRPHLSDSSSEKLFSEANLTELLHTDFPAKFPVSVEIRRGRPATEILSYARTIRAGLIAVGSRGTGGVRELLLGSVSAVVARYSSCSVLVARGAGEVATEPSLKHVLLVVGTSPATEAAIIATQQLVSGGIRQVTLLHVQPFLNADYLFGPFVAPTPSWQLNQSLQKAQREQGEQILHLAKEALESPNLQVETLLQISEPGPLICQVAQQQGVDLVILGSDRKQRSLLPSLPTLRPAKSLERSQEEPRPLLRNTRLGPTADYTIHHAPCPVLLCRSG
ncbi:universal stress protein [Leptothermofonsia sp. ETS-13]|uniref:universal stress protein n=1 Tax=Leptothermofonsia sp. ETS-13 TaxID=3035696 RepID=UPI003B9FC3A1